MISGSVIFRGFAIAVLVASSFSTVTPEQNKDRPWGDVVLNVKLDVKGNAAKLGPFDPFSDGTRTSTAGTHMEIARLDMFSAGFETQSTGNRSLRISVT